MNNLTIDEIEISNRTRNCLRRKGVYYLSQLMLLTEEELAEVRNMGAKSIHEVKEIQQKFKQISETNEGRNADQYDYYVNTSSINKRLVNSVYPALDYRKSNKIVYIIKGIQYNDLSINEMQLSVRSTNALINAGYENANSVLYEKCDIIDNVKNLGAKSKDEIVAFFRRNTRCISTDNPSTQKAWELFEGIKKIMVNEKPSFEFKYISRAILDNIIKSKDELKKIDFNSGLFSDSIPSSVIKLVIVQKNVLAAMINYIFIIIVNSGAPIPYDEIENMLPSVLTKRDVTKAALKYLIETKKIESVEIGFRKKLPSISEWMETLGEREKRVIELRLKGKTLEECGKELGVTRERARQIIDKELKRKPKLVEDDYAYWFKTYCLNFEDLVALFNINERTYGYLNVVYKRGEKGVEEIEDDPHTTKRVLLNLELYNKKDKIIVCGEYTNRTRNAICRKLAISRFYDNEVGIDTFYRQYIEILTNNNIENSEKLTFSSERSFYAWIEKQPYILLKQGRKIRYYPINEYDIEDFVDRLHLEQFKNVEISTYKLFIENKELMNEYNIIDEYELHNLLKKTLEIWNKDNNNEVFFGRMPSIVFGKADKEKQAKDLLFRTAPISLNDYVITYTNEYGVRPNTVIANISKYLTEYYHDGFYSVDQPILNDDEKAYISNELQDDFYFIDDIRDKFIKRFDEQGAKKINPRTLKELGFRVYTNYVINKKYASADDYFIKKYMKTDLLDMSKLDRRYIYLQSSNMAIDKLCVSYDLIEYEEKKYMKYSHLVSVFNSIDKNTFDNYIMKVLNFVDNNVFFTIPFLKKRGFDDELHNIGLDDWFNAGLVKRSKDVRWIKTGGTLLFRKGDVQFTTTDFIRSLIIKEGKEDIDIFIAKMRSQYGINISRHKIIEYIRNSDMYYDSIMEKIYATRQDFYDDI